MPRSIPVLVKLLIAAAFFVVATVAQQPSANASPVNDPRVTTGCNGEDNFDWYDPAHRVGIVANHGDTECSAQVLVYNTFGHATLDDGPQALIAWSPKVYIKPGQTVTLTTTWYDQNCFVQIDVPIGWKGEVLQTLARGAEYGTNMIAAGRGVNRGYEVCEVEKTPTPTPPTPTPVPKTPTSTPTPPTPTATMPVLTQTPFVLQTPTVTSTVVVPTPTSPAVTPSATGTPVITVVPPTASPPPPAKPTPAPPASGSGFTQSQKISWGGAALMLLACAMFFYMGRQSKRRG